jgi:hypothetical protein
MILYHSGAQISTAKSMFQQQGSRFINALPLWAFVVNMSRTT